MHAPSIARNYAHLSLQIRAAEELRRRSSHPSMGCRKRGRQTSLPVLSGARLQSRFLMRLQHKVGD